MHTCYQEYKRDKSVQTRILACITTFFENDVVNVTRGHGNYINILVTMPTRDVLLRHFCKMSLTVGICGCTLLSLMNS